MNYSKRSTQLIFALIAGLALATGYALRGYAEGAPSTKPLFYSGTLESNGRLASGLHTISLALWDAEQAGRQLCVSDTSDSPVDSGRFRVEVSVDCVNVMKMQPDVWVALRFTGPDGVPHELPRRTKVGAVPYAMEAQHAVSASAAASAAGGLAATLQATEQRLLALEKPQTYLYEGAFATPTEWEADLIYKQNYKRFCEAIGKEFVSATELVRHFSSARKNGFFYAGWYYAGPRFCSDDAPIYDAADPASAYSIWKYSGNCGCCIETTNWTMEMRALITCK